MISFDIVQGDSLQVLQSLPENSFDVCVTSPPYYALRNYDGLGDNQLGMEPSHLDYIDKLASIFSEVHRVLKTTGTLWIVIGDTQNGDRVGSTNIRRRQQPGVPPSSLLKIPARLALAMEARDNWVHRDTGIWVKPNPFSESVANRLGRTYEQMLFSKVHTGYYFVRPEEPAKTSKKKRASNNPYAFGGRKDRVKGYGSKTYSARPWKRSADKDTRLMQNVITMAPIAGRKRGQTDGHYATYPVKLCEMMIKASCPPGGTVLDPFCGSGSTGLAAAKLNICSRFVGVDMSQAYCQLARNNLVGAAVVSDRRMMKRISSSSKRRAKSSSSLITNFL